MTNTALAFILLLPLLAFAQQATERYIPIGRSPGVSGISSVQGVVFIAAEDGTSDGAFVLRDSAGQTWTVGVRERTRIFLDRTKAGKTNLLGTLDDVQIGRLVEAWFGADGPKNGGVAQWVKIEALR